MVSLPALPALPSFLQGSEQLILFTISFVILSIATDAVVTFFILGFEHVAKKTRNELDDEIVRILNKRKKYFSILLGVFVAAELIYGNAVVLGVTVYNWFIVFLLLLVGVVSADLTDVLLIFYMHKIAPKTKSRLDDEVLPLARNIIKISIYVLIFTIALSQLGIDIGPIIAGLGIGGLAIGLALQDTLANLFAGMHIIIDRPIRVGDYIQMGNYEGTVKEIGWRTTKILAPGNKEIIIPNRELANSVIINYLKPDSPTGHVVTFGVAYGSDVEKVKSIFMDVCKQMKEEGLIEGGEWVRLDSLGDSSLNFKGGFMVPLYTKRFAAQGRFYELIYNKLNEAGIDIPFPTQTLYLPEGVKVKLESVPSSAASSTTDKEAVKKSESRKSSRKSSSSKAKVRSKAKAQRKAKEKKQGPRRK